MSLKQVSNPHSMSVNLVAQRKQFDIFSIFAVILLNILHMFLLKTNSGNSRKYQCIIY